MRADRRCQDFSDLSAKERRQIWLICAIGVLALFGATIADALLK